MLLLFQVGIRVDRDSNAPMEAQPSLSRTENNFNGNNTLSPELHLSPAFHFVTTQEMDRIPPDVPVVVPVEEVGSDPASDAIRLSQGQLKKLKQRRAKERKQATTEYAGTILDEIVGDAVYIGETRAVEKSIDTMHKQLRQDVATAIQRLDHAVAYLEGEIAREIVEIFHHLYEECVCLSGQVVDIILNDLVDAAFDPFFETILTTAAHERMLLQEAAAGRNRNFVRELFVAAFPFADPHSHGCSVCIESVNVLDPGVSTVMCCDGRGLLCGGCRPGLVRAHENNVIPHAFSESFTQHVDEWVGRMRLAFND